jgi:phage-related protein
MFDPIINALNAVWEALKSFIEGILDFILAIISSCFDVLISVVKFMFWQTLDFCLSLISPSLIALINALPDFNPWTPNIIGYLSTINQIFPVTEFFVCMSCIFGFWCIVWGLKTLKQFVPLE